jgi:hypothetical protein
MARRQSGQLRTSFVALEAMRSVDRECERDFKQSVQQIIGLDAIESTNKHTVTNKLGRMYGHSQ